MFHKAARISGAFLLTLLFSSLYFYLSSLNTDIHPRSLSQSSKSGDKLTSPQKAKNEVKNTPTESSVLLSDPAMSLKWGVTQIDLQKALKVSQGSRDIVIAVIDTGIDVNHPDLRNNLWVNPGETGKDKNGVDLAGNGKDDDGNGCIDDVFGCNFITMRGKMDDLADNHGHGTHISGIIGAEGGNGVGVSGVSPKVRLMTLKYYDSRVKTNHLLNTVNAFHYAVWMKKKYNIKKMIINYSGGGVEYSRDEFLAVQSARQAGILLVAAAGNERSNSDKFKYYPAGYDLDNIISVTAVNPKTQVLPSSNYGIQSVDLAAPGENIYSTMPSGQYGLMTGTSQATAFVTGVAALIMAHNSDFSAEEVKKYILKTGDDIPSLNKMTGTSKRLNSYRALVTLDQGVGATGVLASNTANMKPAQFAAVPQLDPNSEPTEVLNSFGRDLLKVIKDKNINMN